ncbi:MAG TPA: S9 family peptidase [Pyrinomonadaceae bacterium]|nr:S9 family peptidase [Pyrinomonadaceae bacterium]
MSSNSSGFFNAYSIPVAGGPTKQLTFSTTQHLRPIACFPRDDRILMTRDPDSSEATELFVRYPSGAEVTLQNQEARASFLGFIPGTNSFYCSSNQRIASLFDLYVVNADSFSWELIYRNDTHLFPCRVSKNSRYLALMEIHSTDSADVFIYDFVSADLVKITNSEPLSYCRFASFDPASSYLYYLTDANTEWTYVVELNIHSQATRVAAQSTTGILQYWFSPTGKYKVIFYDKDGGTQVNILDRRTNSLVKHLGSNEVSIGSLTFSPDDGSIAYFGESNSNPAVLYHHDFAADQTRPVSSFTGRQIVKNSNLCAKALSFCSFDALPIPSVLWYPRKRPTDRTLPALVWVHGGPGGQIRTGYNSRIACLVQSGFVVLGCNYRGSFGYGRSFLAADIGDAAGPLLDLVYAKQFLSSLSFVDETRIGLIGSSFGGYLVLAALAFYPEEFFVGVDICGVSDWISMLENLPQHWRSVQQNSLFQKIGHPERDREKLRRISPLYHAERIKKPLLVLHGANDPRVPQAQSDLLVEAVKRGGGMVDYMIFSDEAHGLRHPVNSVKAYQSILEFLKRHL